MKHENPLLKDGLDYQLNQSIVGNESGLRNLIKACESAIDNGSFVGEGLDDFEGVHKLESDFLINTQEDKSTPLVLSLVFVFALFIAFLVVLGGISFVNWF